MKAMNPKLLEDAVSPSRNSENSRNEYFREANDTENNGNRQHPSNNGALNHRDENKNLQQKNQPKNIGGGNNNNSAAMILVADHDDPCTPPNQETKMRVRSTIKVPKNLSMLHLPSPCYPSANLDLCTDRPSKIGHRNSNQGNKENVKLPLLGSGSSSSGSGGSLTPDSKSGSADRAMAGGAPKRRFRDEDRLPLVARDDNAIPQPKFRMNNNLRAGGKKCYERNGNNFF